MLLHWHCSYCYLETKSETGLRGQDKFSCPINVYSNKESASRSLEDTYIMRLRMNDRKQAEISNLQYLACVYVRQTMKDKE